MDTKKKKDKYYKHQAIWYVYVFNHHEPLQCQ